MSWWSTTPWAARTICRRRPGRSLALGCITSVGVSSTRMWYAVVMVVDMKVHESFNMFDNIKYMWAGGRRHRGRQGQHGEGNQEGQWQIGCITSVGIFSTWCDMLRRLWLTCKFFYTFNMSDNIKYMWVGGWRHHGRQGQHGEEDHKGRWKNGCIN